MSKINILLGIYWCIMASTFYGCGVFLDDEYQFIPTIGGAVVTATLSTLIFGWMVKKHMNKPKN